jgi:hypothetical protein
MPMKINKPNSTEKSKVLLKKGFHNNENPEYVLIDIRIDFTEFGIDLSFKDHENSDLRICCEEWKVYRNNYEDLNYIVTDIVIIYNKKNIFIQVIFHHRLVLVNNTLIDCFEATANFRGNPSINRAADKIKLIPRENDNYRYLFIEQQD